MLELELTSLELELDFIENMASLDSELQSQFKKAFHQMDRFKTLDDPNSIRSYVEHYIPATLDSKQRTVLLVYFLNGYASHVSNTQLAFDYLIQLSLEFLDLADLELIYSNGILTDQFNEFLSIYFPKCRGLTLNRLVETLKEYKSSSPVNKLNKFTILVVKQLAKQREFAQIVDLYDNYSICQFTEIDSAYIKKINVFFFFWDVIRSLIANSRNQDCYDMFQILFQLPIKNLKKRSMEMVMSYYIIALLKLNKIWPQIDANILKFAAYVPPNVLKIYQCYQSYNVNMFVNYFYREHMICEKNNESIDLFSVENLLELLENLSATKLNILTDKISGLSDEEKEKLNPVSRLQFVLKELKLDFAVNSGNVIQDTRSNDLYQILLQDTIELAECNSSMKKFKENHEMFLKLKEFQKPQKVKRII